MLAESEVGAAVAGTLEAYAYPVIGKLPVAEVTPGHELAPAVEDRLDALAQQRPELAVDVEVAAEVEQRALADAATVALGADQAVGVVDGAVGGTGLPAGRKQPDLAQKTVPDW